MAGNQELRDGRWRPAVPLPFFGVLHVTCSCGRKFWGRHSAVRESAPYFSYETHYQAAHAVMRGDPR